jgi:shikimate dehydrogenase
MKKFISLSEYPGTTGQYYYTKFFNQNNIDATYTPRGTDNLAQALAIALEEKVDGISISMPYKKEVIQYLDQSDSLVTQYQSCNTVLVKNKKLFGFNTDFYGAEYVISQIPDHLPVSILGDGSIGSMIKLMLKNDPLIISRKSNNWNDRHTLQGVVINCTSFGTATPDSPFSSIPQLDLVIDLAIKNNQLEEQCRKAGIKYIRGIEFYKYQFQKQFEIYAGTAIDVREFE